MVQRPRPAILAAVFLVLVLRAVAGQGSSPETIVSGQALSIPVPLVAGERFRFLPEGAWLTFDRPLVLSASPGEERSYALEIERAGAKERRDYRIDRRPPSPPLVSPSEGLYSSPLSLELKAEPGATIHYALLGPGSSMPIFLDYDPRNQPRLAPRSSGTSSWVLLAYAVDAAGNRSDLLRLAYRLAPPGLSAMPPPSSGSRLQPRPDSLLEIPAPERRLESGRAELLFKKPDKGRLMAAVSAGSAVALAEAYADLPEREGRLCLALEAPYGWSGELSIAIALVTEEGFRYRADAFRLKLENLPPKPAAAVEPPAPSILAGAPGTGGVLVFPAYEGELRFSMDGAPEIAYTGPLAVSPGSGRLRIEWRGISSAGAVSPIRSLDLRRPPPLPPLVLRGVEGPSLGSSPRRISAPEGATLRYELSSDGSMPPEPSSSSVLLGTELLLDCPAGEERSFSLRVRPFSGEGADAVAGDSVVYTFRVDKTPPPPPFLVESLASYSRESLSINLGAREGKIFASLAPAGQDADFSELRAPLVLLASRERPLSYVVRAYALDAAGNRSAELGPLTYTIDGSTVYAAGGAPSGGIGSPERPYSDLAEAIAAAQSSGRRLLKLRGTFRLSSVLTIRGGVLSIEGGFDDSWQSSGGRRGNIVLIEPRAGTAPLVVESSQLSLRNLTISAGAGEGCLIAAADSAVTVEGSKIEGKSQGELILVSMRGGSMNFGSSILALGGKGGGALFSTESTRLEIQDSELATSARLDYFGGIDIRGGSLLLSGSLLSGEADLGLVLCSAKSAGVEIDRTSFKVLGGPGFVRIGRLSGCQGELRNSRAEFTASGSGMLFDLENSSLGFVHDSFFAQAGEGRLRFFSLKESEPRFMNSLFYAPEGAELFLSTDRELAPGDITACAFGGFSAYVEGPTMLGTIDGLVAVNRGLSLPPSLALATKGIFMELPKNGPFPLSTSPLRDAALPLAGDVYARDFHGLPRPGEGRAGLPDIGADEIQP